MVADPRGDAGEGSGAVTHALVEENARLRAEAEKLQRERDEADERADFWFGAWDEAIARAEQAEAVARAVDVLDRDPRALVKLATETQRLRIELEFLRSERP